MNCLQRVFEGKNDERINGLVKKMIISRPVYADIIQMLDEKENEESLQILFPFEIKNIWPGLLEQTEWPAFIYDFAKAFVQIKDVRNKTVHPKDMENKKIREAIDQMRDIIERISSIVYK